MKKPLFSVMILTHNRSDLLQEAIQSVLAQTFQDFEIIIIDDHSTDNTCQVVSSYQDKRIKYYLNERSKGQAGARNTAISKSKGEWIAFLDDDDVWLPLKLEKQAEMIKVIDNNVGLIYTGYATYDFEKETIIKKILPEKKGWVQDDVLYSNCIGAICSVAVRKSLLDRVGGFDERFESMVDMDMWVRISGISMVVFIKDVLVYVRKSNKDRISSNMKRKLNGSTLFWDKYKLLIDKDARLKQRAASRVITFAIQEHDRASILKAFPWTLLGFFYDVKNFQQTLKEILVFSYHSILRSSNFR